MVNVQYISPTCLITSILVMVFACSISSTNDVYLKIPLRSKLEFEKLRNAEQIYPYHSELILTYNISPNSELYNPHLLFFDSNLVLLSACYFPSEHLDKIEKDTIIGYLNKERQDRASLYRQELPINYHLKLKEEKDGGKGQQSNVIVNKIELVNEYSLKFFVIKSLDLYANYNESIIQEKYTEHDTLIYPIHVLHFNYEKKIIARPIINNNYVIWDELFVPNKIVLDDFYAQLWSRIKKK